MTTLPKTYDFNNTEERIYKMWEKGGYFKPTNDPNEAGHDPSKKPYVLTIPPPNVTGKLHLGHAMFVSMEDLMIRYHRMQGIPTLWVPGSDHAGIATQLQVERALREEGTSREEIGREKFLERTWAWKKEYGGHITRQIRRLGASCDWSRERFTLDEGLSKAVRVAFVRLYEKGLIYRGPRLINWSPGLKTAVSDLEVEYSEEQGKLYFFKYMIAGSEEFIPVATTRPETILGDTAVAVHPEDGRYKNFIGKMALVPILGREIPVIGDEYVDREFGTGALKITPGHDPNDYEIGERHKLEIISVLDNQAKVNQHGGPYEGQDRFEARQNLWQDMRAQGLVIKEEDYLHQVPRSQRGGEIVEPMVSTQWFVEIKPLADKAVQAVRDGRINIVPQHFTKVYYNWMENIRDWCISRQLWWGHRIPVWYCDDCREVTVARQDPTKCAHCDSPNIKQDPDVLDTWFSSGLWPFSTLGWPEDTPDLKYFYPTTMMETGYDILFFWVARMIMSGLEYTDQIPFSEIYLHGLIRDETGRKMSKSYGNVIDPLEVMDELGTDALRFTLLVGSTPGNDMNLSLKKVEANRNFANKLWNATRLILGNLEDLPHPSSPPKGEGNWTLADSWIWARQRSLRDAVKRLFENYQYGEAGRQIYEFFWNEFADWYLEIAKLQIAEPGNRAYTTAQVLVSVLDTCLRLLHPFTPFVTEELWGHLKGAVLDSPLSALAADWPEVLMMAPWPEPEKFEGWEEQAETDFGLVQDIVRSIRNLRAEKNVKPSTRIPALLAAGDAHEIIAAQAGTIAALARLDAQKLSILPALEEKPEGHVALVVGAVEIFLPLADMVDTAEERARLEKDLAEALSHIERLEKLLNSPFAEKAPENVVQTERDKLAGFKETAEKVNAQIESFG
jgi:valyl-tRNA synthetase